MIFIKLIKVYADLDTKNKYYKIVIFCNIRITTNPILLYYTVKRKEKDYGKYLKN